MKWTFPLIVLMLAVLPLELAGAQGPSTTRRAMATGGPIVAQLRPTDRVVTLEINGNSSPRPVWSAA